MVQLRKGYGQDRKRSSHVTSPAGAVTPILAPGREVLTTALSVLLPLQCCGVDFEVKAFATQGTDTEEDKIPKK